MVKILLVDDHEVVLEGLSNIFAEREEFEVVGKLKSAEEALTFIRKYSVDVVFMDIIMPGIGGLEGTRRVLQINPDVNVIVLSAYGERPYPYHLLRAGAKGYLTKGCSADEMIKAVNHVLADKIYLESKISDELALQSINNFEDFSPFDLLSSREMQLVLMLLKHNKLTDIADELHLSAKTVSTYRRRVLDKLGVKSNVELVQLAMRYRILDDKTAAIALHDENA